MPYQIIYVLGGLGVDIGWLIETMCVAGCVPLASSMDDCSRIFCCLCAIMPKRRICVKEQNLSRRLFAILLSWMRAALLVSCFFSLFFRLAATEGRTLARAVANSVAVSWRVVPA